MMSRSFRYLPVLFSSLLLACGILFQSSTLIQEDQSSTTTLTIAIDQALLSDPDVASRWEEQVHNISGYLQQRGGVITAYDSTAYSGIQASFSFPDLLTLNSALTGSDISLFQAFTLKRWRGEFVFEARTTSALIRQRMMEITGLSEGELLLVQFPLEISIRLPGQLTRSNSFQTGADSTQTWAINWLVDQEHYLYATSRVPLIPPVIEQPVTGTRIKDAEAGVDFAGTGEPGADIRLFRVQGSTRTMAARGSAAEDGTWLLPDVAMGEPGEYQFQVEETTDHESALSNLPAIELRPLEPIVFVPGYYACSEGIFQTNINWHWTLYPTSFPASDLIDTGLLIFTTGNGFYGPFLEYFDDQGYQLGKNFFVACYNWAASLPEEAEKLQEVLDWARVYNTSGLPLTVITHSNGGLVTRYYIQHNPLRARSQISDLIMIAPPNHGVVKTYYAWEGGDISLGGTENMALRSLVATALQRRCGILAVPNTRDYQVEWHEYQVKVHDCLRYGKLLSPVVFDLGTAPDNSITSIGWLLPNCGSQTCGFMQYPDAPISRLNSSDQIDSLFSGIQGNLYILAGSTGNSTLADIPLAARSESDHPLWINGKPNGDPIKQAGDDTVLVESVFLPEATAFPGRYHPYPVFTGADHATGMVQRMDILTTISQIIRESAPSERETATSSSDFLIVWVESPVNLLVIDARGRRAGIDEQGNVHKEIPGTSYGDLGEALGPKFLLIDQPAGGEYQFQVTGLAEGDYELYAYASNSETPIVAEAGHVSPGEVRAYHGRYAASAAATLPLLLSVLCAVGAAVIAIVLIRRTRKRQRTNDFYGDENFPDWTPSDNLDDFSDDPYQPKRRRRWFRRKPKDPWDS